MKKISPLLSLAISLTILSIIPNQVTEAQIIPDNTLGLENSTVREDNINNLPSDVIEGGASRGSNLFHSFQEFNINEGRGAYFANPAVIQNIFSRVTGGNISQILGTLGVLGNANLYLINPNGIFFGANARLDVRGAFISSTADSLIFNNNYEFSASNPTAPPLLTVDIPMGLRFRGNSADILLETKTAGYGVEESQTLALIGGNVILDDADIFSPGSNIYIGGLKQTGVVSLVDGIKPIYPENIERGNVELRSNSEVSTFNAENNRGNITINANSLTITNESDLSVFTLEGDAGNITIVASESVTLDQKSTINIFARSQGIGGSVFIETSELKILNGSSILGSVTDQQGGNVIINASELVEVSGSVETAPKIFSGSSIVMSTLGNGDAGNIEINTKNLLVKDGGNISTQALTGQRKMGNGGSIIINASEIEVKGATPNALNISQISSDTLGKGNGGNIEINSDKLIVSDGATVSSFTVLGSSGKGGMINIHANESIEIIGTRRPPFNTSPTTLDTSSGGTGDAGDINIFTNNLIVKDGGEINSSTSNLGQAGNINITALNAVNITGTSSRFVRIISKLTSETSGSGNSGNIIINTPQLTVSDSAGIEAFTQGEGKAGNITINASESLILNTNTNLIVESRDAGIAGNININTPELTIGENARLSATATVTSTAPTAGNINLNINQLNISGELGIFAETNSQADAGSLTIQAYQNNPNLNIQFTENGFISARTTSIGDGGSITLTAPENIDISGLGSITAETSGEGDAGNIKLTSENLNLSQEVTISVSTAGDGNAGQITVTANNLTLTNQSTIATNTASNGEAGDIILNLQDNLNLNNSAIAANTQTNSTGRGGDIIINSPPVINLDNNASITVNSQGEGDGGNISLTTVNLTLNDDSTISATTASGEGGNLSLNVTENLIQENNSPISATAGGTGNGGNITINTEYLIGSDNSPITANAFEGNGGNINITAKGIFRDLGSPITASSELGVDGIVETNTPEVDPSRGLVNLPTNIVDANDLIAENACRRGNQSEFTVRGKGGLPSSPQQVSNTSEVEVGLIESTSELPSNQAVNNEVNLTESISQTSSNQDITNNNNDRKIILAQGWQKNEKGELVLVAYPTEKAVNRKDNSQVTCPAN